VGGRTCACCPQLYTRLTLLLISSSLAGAAAAAGGGPAVALLDTNLATHDACTAFSERLGNNYGMESFPPPTVDTTVKQRSVLHGQCYDKKKCLKVVKGPKDKIAATKGLLSGKYSVFPKIEETEGLPSHEWASDHALVSTTLTYGWEEIMDKNVQMRRLSNESGAEGRAPEVGDLVNLTVLQVAAPANGKWRPLTELPAGAQQHSEDRPYVRACATKGGVSGAERISEAARGHVRRISEGACAAEPCVTSPGLPLDSY
jgi:hypothetical protein